VSLYILPNEFKQAPTGIDTATLDQTNIGNQAAQDAALMNILRRASSWVDTIVQQETLEATTNTETKEVYMARDGRINIHVDQVPIISLISAQFRGHPRATYQSVDLGSIEVRDNWFTIYDLFYNPTLSQDLMGAGIASASYMTDIYAGFSSPYYRKSDIPLTVQYTYLNGYTNTTLTVAAAVNATSVTVKDSTGLTVNQRVTIYDGANTETVVVQAVNGNVITLTSGLLFAHAVGIGFSAIPDAVKQATVMLAAALIKDRGSLAITMQETSIMNVNPTPYKTDEVSIARELLAPYRRVVVS
jgi:hypothetical protein